MIMGREVFRRKSTNRHKIQKGYERTLHVHFPIF